MKHRKKFEFIHISFGRRIVAAEYRAGLKPLVQAGFQHPMPYEYWWERVSAIRY